MYLGATMKSQKGFTLMELMIVIAIIGILAAVAIPVYQDYIGRAQMAEALSLASGQKGAVAEFYSANNECPVNSVSNTAGGLAKPSQISGKYVLSVTVKEDKTQTIKLGSDSVQSICGVVAKMRSSGVNGNISGSELGLYMAVTSGAFQWGCVSNALKQYLPTSCQN